MDSARQLEVPYQAFSSLDKYFTSKCAKDHTYLTTRKRLKKKHNAWG